jgi:DNA-binding transcriptional MocR family regulator
MMSFAGGLPAEAMLPKSEWSDMPRSIGQYGMSEGEPQLREALPLRRGQVLNARRVR